MPSCIRQPASRPSLQGLCLQSVWLGAPSGVEQILSATRQCSDSTAACVRLRHPVLFIIAVAYDFTVDFRKPSTRARAFFDRPPPNRIKTRRSWRVSEKSL